jgi:hypothetical protein
MTQFNGFLIVEMNIFLGNKKSSFCEHMQMIIFEMLLIFFVCVSV